GGAKGAGVGGCGGGLPNGGGAGHVGDARADPLIALRQGLLILRVDLFGLAVLIQDLNLRQRGGLGAVVGDEGAAVGVDGAADEGGAAVGEGEVDVGQDVGGAGLTDRGRLGAVDVGDVREGGVEGEQRVAVHLGGGHGGEQ